MLRRRSFMVSAACALIDAPQLAAARPVARPHRIGMLSGGGLQANANWDAFYASMRGLGYVEGRDVVYERRAARGEPERLPLFARDLVATNPRLIVTTGGWEVI